MAVSGDSKNVLSSELRGILVCPACHADLKFVQQNSTLLCKNKDCKKEFPIINGIPVMQDNDLHENE